jgi:hypothetical protein
MEKSTATSGTMIIHKKDLNNQKSISKEKQSLTYTELKLKLPKKVTWTEETIDNEHMNKRKSKSKINY